ncbi:MAG: hypothetical protein WD646_15515 [Actinomycetota bacterium]
MFAQELGSCMVLIECHSCLMQHSDHCKDCVVSVLLEPSPRHGAVVVDADEERALRELAGAGLIPQIKMRSRRRSA